MLNDRKKTLAIIGAGPKGLAVAVKAKVLEEFGFPVDRVVLIEKHSVGANWTGEVGYTNGRMKLGTSPEKDVVFPIETETGDANMDRRIRQRLMNFTWTSFLVDRGEFSDWVDRGRPSPCHEMWATYLRWVSAQLSPEVTIVNAEVDGVDLNSDGTRWAIRLHDSRAGIALPVLHADSLMMTGPGRTRLAANMGTLPFGVYDLQSFWKAMRSEAFPLKGRIAIVGAGENSASVLLALAEANPHLRTDVISPRGFLVTRAENYYENQFYSQPEKMGWNELTQAERSEFIERTDLGVFSVHAMQVLNDQILHRIVPGRMIGLQESEAGLTLSVQHGERLATRVYDRIILATGFDQLATLKSMLSESTVKNLEMQIGGPFEQRGVTQLIDNDMSVQGLRPCLYLPMLSGLNQGPGFANLSCLGRLSDRILLGGQRATITSQTPVRKLLEIAR